MVEHNGERAHALMHSYSVTFSGKSVSSTQDTIHTLKHNIINIVDTAVATNKLPQQLVKSPRRDGVVLKLV